MSNDVGCFTYPPVEVDGPSYSNKPDHIEPYSGNEFGKADSMSVVDSGSSRDLQGNTRAPQQS